MGKNTFNSFNQQIDIPFVEHKVRIIFYYYHSRGREETRAK